MRELVEHPAVEPPGFRWGMATAVIVLVVICLAAVDRFLARVESTEIQAAAQQSYSEGTRLLEEGKPAQAVNFLRDAYTSERDNPLYELQLIAALMETGKSAEAAPLLDEILQRYPNDGRANLLEARLEARQGDIDSAESYYHRAIYGEWAGNAARRRNDARMELIELLARQNRKEELLAELISLQASAPEDIAMQRRVAQLFLQAGAPSRAAAVYEALARKNPQDVADYEGLGEAELRQGDYGAARNAFLKALAKEPGSPSARKYLNLVNTLTDLDPALRQLTPAEKYGRSLRILGMAQQALTQCAGKGGPGAPGLAEDRQLLRDAQAMLSAKRSADATNEMAEGVLSLAEKLWHAEIAACGQPAAGTNALDLIMNKLTP